MPANRRREARKLHICVVEDCRKAFERKSDLNRHKGVHLEYHQYKYVCLFCNKRFNQSANRKTHMLAMHSREKFICGIDGCTKDSRHRSTIRKHRQRHEVNGKMDSDEEEHSSSHITLAPRPTLPPPPPALPTLFHPIAPFPSLASQRHIHGHPALDVPFDFRSTDQKCQTKHQQTPGLPSTHFDNRRRSLFIPRPFGGPYYTPGHVERLPRFVPTPPIPPPNVRFLFG